MKYFSLELPQLVIGLFGYLYFAFIVNFDGCGQQAASIVKRKCPSNLSVIGAVVVVFFAFEQFTCKVIVA